VVLVVLLSSDRTVMGERTNSLGARLLGWTCSIVMTIAAIALFVL
jgi:Mn2+/Fe2+ NRAMP family transporter